MVTSLLFSLMLAQDPVSLQEVRTVHVPPDLNVTHSSHTSRALYLLDRRSPALLRVTPDTTQVLTNRDIVGAIGVTDDSAGVLTIVVDSPAALVRLTLDGRVLTRTPLPGVEGGTVVAAAYNAGAWAFVVNREAKEGRLYCTRDPTAGNYRHVELPFAPGPRLASRSAEEHMYLTLERTPFWTYAINITDCQLQEISALAPQLIRSSSADVGASWFTVAITRVGEELWITLADLQSDRRLIAVLRPNGALVRSRILTVPLAIISAQGKEVVALRNVSGQELIYYRIQTPVHPTLK